MGCVLCRTLSKAIIALASKMLIMRQLQD